MGNSNLFQFENTIMDSMHLVIELIRLFLLIIGPNYPKICRKIWSVCYEY